MPSNRPNPHRPTEPPAPLDYGRPTPPTISPQSKAVGYSFIGVGVSIAVHAALQSNPSARVNIALVAFWSIIIGLYLRFRRARP